MSSRARPAPAPARLRLAPHALLACFCAGLVGALGHRPPSASAVAAGALGAAALAAAWAGRGRRAVPAARAALALLALCAGVAGWAWGGARLEATAPPRLEGLPAHARGLVTVDAPPVPDGRGGRRARAAVEEMWIAGGARVAPGARVLLDLPPGAERPEVGRRLRVEGRLRPPAGPDAPAWWRRWLERQGVAARMRPRLARPSGRRGGLAGLRDRWREWATANAAAGVGGDRGAIVRGMALGGGSGLTEEAAEAFRDAGLWHLLAVSGQNVTVVAIAALALLRAGGVPRRPAVGAAAAVMTAYCLACDGGASVGRAGIVGGLGLLAELRSSPRERWHLLLAGLALLLAAQPRAIGDPGLQLSFAAVAGLFVVAPPLGAWWRGWLPGRIADLAAMAGAAGLATAPVLVWHFGRLSLAGLLLNVVAVPLAAPVVVLALAGLAAGALLPAAGAALAWVAGLGAEALLLASRAAAAVPGAAVDLPRAAVAALVPLAAAPPLVAAALARAPGDRPRALRPAPLLAGALAAVAVIVALGTPGPPPPWPAAPALTVLDVGQGDAVLLRSPEGAAALLDAGPPGARAPVLEALARAGVRRLDALVLSHDSLDHVGGLVPVLESLPVGLLVHPPEPEDGFAAPARAGLAAARSRGVPVRAAGAAARLAVGEWRVRVLWPARAAPRGSDPNDSSMVVLASARGMDALVTSDAESGVLTRLPLGSVDVMKVAHHGSEDPGLPAVLRRLRPRLALISVGAGNPFGHPRAPTLEALRAAGARTLRTDRSGDLTVGPGGEGVAVVAGG